MTRKRTIKWVRPETDHRIYIPSATVHQIKKPDAYASGFLVSWTVRELKDSMQASADCLFAAGKTCYRFSFAQVPISSPLSAQR